MNTENENSKRNRTLTNEVRTMIIQKYEKGKSAQEISDELDIKYCTAAAVVRKYKKTGVIESEKGNCGRKGILNENDGVFVKAIIKDDASASLKQMKSKIEDTLHKSVSTTTIHRMLKTFEYSFKRIQLIPVRRNQENNKEVRFNYARTILQIEINKLVFIDEMGVNCSMKKRYGRAPIGQTPRKNVTTIRSKNISVAAAVIKEELLYFKTRNGAYNTECFSIFINELLNKLNDKNLKNMTIICDNVPFHKSTEILSIIQDAGHSLIFLPPYTPQLNPIEEVFSAWKEHIRGMNCENYDSLTSAIDICSGLINRNQCEAFFRHMNIFLIKAMAREDF